MTAHPRLMTVEEAARAIHSTVKPGYIRAAIRDGRLTAVQHGKRYMIAFASKIVHCGGEERERANAARPSNRNERVRFAMAIKHPIPVDILRQLLRLDSETGRLYWRKRDAHWFNGSVKRPAEQICASWNTKFAGSEALYGIGLGGYRAGSMLGGRYYAHRVVFALFNGRWPDGDVDHRDMDRSNNCPTNLREATRRQNKRNGRALRGYSKFCGVSWDKERSKWVAYARDAAGVSRHLGRYDREEDAARARDAAVSLWHGDFARLNFSEGA